MEKGRVSREEKENQILDLYYNQGKTYREITEIAGTYPREIKAILKKADPSQSQSKPSQAYQLFLEGNTVTQVAIALDIRQLEASELFAEYWLLQQQDELYRIFREIKNNIRFFLQLYRQALAAGMNVQDVIRALGIAKNDLRSIEYKYKELIKQADSLVASNLNAAKTSQELSDQISGMKKTLDLYESLCKEKRLELAELNEQKIKLQSLTNHLRDNGEEYSRIKDIVKGEVESTLTNLRQLLMLAVQSVIESARRDSSDFYALVYNFPSPRTRRHSSTLIDDNQSNNASYLDEHSLSNIESNSEDTYKKILLNEAEELYNQMIISHMDKAISNINSAKQHSC